MPLRPGIVVFPESLVLVGNELFVVGSVVFAKGAEVFVGIEELVRDELVVGSVKLSPGKEEFPAVLFQDDELVSGSVWFHVVFPGAVELKMREVLVGLVTTWGEVMFGKLTTAVTDRLPQMLCEKS